MEVEELLQSNQMRYGVDDDESLLDQRYYDDDDAPEMVSMATQSLSWNELAIQMVSDIVSHQVIQMKIERTEPSSGSDELDTLKSSCMHLKGMAWKDIADMIVGSHDDFCHDQQTKLIDNVVRVTVDWPHHEVKPSVELHILSQVKREERVLFDDDDGGGGIESSGAVRTDCHASQVSEDEGSLVNSQPSTNIYAPVNPSDGANIDIANGSVVTCTDMIDEDSSNVADSMLKSHAMVGVANLPKADVAKIDDESPKDVVAYSILNIGVANLTVTTGGTNLSERDIATTAKIAEDSFTMSDTIFNPDIANPTLTDDANMAQAGDVATSKQSYDYSSRDVVTNSILNEDNANSAVTDVPTRTQLSEVATKKQYRYSSGDIKVNLLNADVANPTVTDVENLMGTDVSKSTYLDCAQGSSQQKDENMVAGEKGLSSNSSINDTVKVYKHVENVDGTETKFGKQEMSVKGKVSCKDKVDSRKKVDNQCEPCGKTFRTALQLKRHLDSHKNQLSNKKSGFHCDVCGKVFQTLVRLNTHKLIHSPNHKDHPCEHCNKTCKTVQSLQRHQRIHRLGSLTCKECGAAFQLQQQLKQHRLKEHNLREMFSCDVCNAVYKNEATLKDHLVEHTGKEFLCDICGKKFRRPELLRCHRYRHETNNKPKSFQCSMCPKVYSTDSTLQIHIRLTHFKERKYICGVCSKDFFYRYQMVAHEQAHKGVMQHTCKYCNKGFLKRASMLTHEMVHTGHTPYKCRQCSKGFSTKAHLGRHEKTHMNTPKPKRLFKCKTCNASFGHKGQCSDHEKRHAGIKAHVCQFCNKGFVSRGDMIRHLRTHTGGKPYKCKHCDLSFPRRIDLLRHEGSHGDLKK